MEREIVVPYDEFTRMAAAEEKLSMLIDSLLNNSQYLAVSERFCIEPVVFEAIMMTFDREGYKNAVKRLKEKEALNV